MQRPFSPCEEEEEGKGGMTADAEGEEDGGAALWTADGGDSPLPVLGDVTRRNRGLEGERKGRTEEQERKEKVREQRKEEEKKRKGGLMEPGLRFCVTQPLKGSHCPPSTSI